MSEKGPISRFLDNRKLEKSNKTRIHDSAKAEEMAYAEKPHRERAAQQKKVGKALVNAVWDKYPVLDAERVIPVSEISDRVAGEMSEADIVARTGEGVSDLHKRVESNFPTSVRGEKKQKAQLDVLAQADPSALPYDLAQSVGYELQDTSAENSLAAAENAGEVAGHEYDQTIAENKRQFAEDFDRAHGQY